MIAISQRFDGGNIEPVDSELDPQNIRLRIRRDAHSDFFQWFYFRITGAAATPLTLNFMDVDQAAYPRGFEDYSLVVSEDRRHWRRVATRFDGATLSCEFIPSSDSVYVAYFAPFTTEQHADLIASCLAQPDVRYRRLGASIDGRDMDLLDAGSQSPADPAYWLIARQHPGETMAEWWMQGFLRRLLDPNDAVARELREHTRLYVVPNMNPDGSARGHLRTNAAGANLNREWASPSPERSPEVACVLAAMDEMGLNFCLDVHGDEALPYNFIAGPEGTPSWNNDRQRELDAFKNALARLTPDFQTEHGYPVSPPGTADMSICTNAIAERFGCLAMTLEMPFKDSLPTAMPEVGWSPERCQRLGATHVDALWWWRSH